MGAGLARGLGPPVFGGLRSPLHPVQDEAGSLPVEWGGAGGKSAGMEIRASPPLSFSRVGIEHLCLQSHAKCWGPMCEQSRHGGCPHGAYSLGRGTTHQREAAPVIRALAGGVASQSGGTDSARASTRESDS